MSFKHGFSYAKILYRHGLLVVKNEKYWYRPKIALSLKLHIISHNRQLCKKYQHQFYMYFNRHLKNLNYQSFIQKLQNRTCFHLIYQTCHFQNAVQRIEQWFPTGKEFLPREEFPLIVKFLIQFKCHTSFLS